jgi:hypothetical protein
VRREPIVMSGKNSKGRVAGAGTGQYDYSELAKFLRSVSKSSQKSEPSENAIGKNERKLKKVELVRVSIVLLMSTRRAGLSPTESGCLFLVIASHLLEDIPADGLAELIGEARAFG